MKLVLITAKGKTPFIGICHNDEKTALTNVKFMQDVPYTIKVQILPGRVNLKLLMKGHQVAEYPELIYHTPMAFDSFVKADKPAGVYKFGHVVWEIGSQRYNLIKENQILKVISIAII